MKSHLMAGILALALMLGAPLLAPAASAQPTIRGDNTPSRSFVPMVVGAAAGATVAALLWPVVVPASAAVVAAPGAVVAAPMAAAWSWGAFMTTRAMVGALVGSGMGYLASR